MWKNINDLNLCNKNLSDFIFECTNGKIPENAHGVKYKYANNKKDLICTNYDIDHPLYVKNIEGQIKYSKEDPKEYIYESTNYNYPDEIFMTDIGELNLCDNGEFGGYLELNGQILLHGNFNHIFEFQERKFVIDSLHHMACARFRLVEIFKNGTFSIIYTADKLEDLHNKFYETPLPDNKEKRKEIFNLNSDKYKLNINYEVGFRLMKIFDNKLYFYCSGDIYDFKESGKNRRKSVNYILEYDGKNFKEHNIEIDDYFNEINSFEITNDSIYLGLNKQILKYNKITKECFFLTDLSDAEIAKLKEI